MLINASNSNSLMSAFCYAILLLLIPILGVFCLLSLNEEDKNSKNIIKTIALSASLVNLIISIIIWFQFDNSSSSYQFVYEFNELKFCHFHIGIDGISLYFVLLTCFITPGCILSN